MSSSVRHIERQYGPIAFGLIALLCLWALIIKPELDSSRTAHAGTADTLKEAAFLMNETSKRLERIEIRWENPR